MITIAITCVTARCDLGFFCETVTGRRDTLPGEGANDLDQEMKTSQPNRLKMSQTRNRAMARFLANRYKFLERENNYGK